MHDLDAQSPKQKRKTSWSSIIIAAVWITLACIPLLILIRLQQQAERELLAARERVSVEQDRHSELKEKESRTIELGVELAGLKNAVRKLFSAFSSVHEMPEMDSPLPVTYAQSDDCLWIWVPIGDQTIELCTGFPQQEQLPNSQSWLNYFSTLMKTTTFRMPSPGWYRVSYNVAWATDSEDAIKVEFTDFQRGESVLVPLGGTRFFGRSGYSGNTELIYWPNQIPSNLVRNTGQPITNSRLEADATPLLQKLTFDSSEHSLFCCLKLRIKFQQSDSASTDQPYQGDNQQLERAIIESHRFMR